MMLSFLCLYGIASLIMAIALIDELKRLGEQPNILGVLVVSLSWPLVIASIVLDLVRRR